MLNCANLHFVIAVSNDPIASLNVNGLNFQERLKINEFLTAFSKRDQQTVTLCDRRNC